MAGRGGHEKMLRKLKQHLAFDTVPTQDRDTNTAWLLISALAYSVVRRFQLSTGASERHNGLGCWVAAQPSGTRASISPPRSPRRTAALSCAGLLLTGLRAAM